MIGDQTDVFGRIKRLLPNWFGQDAAPTPILDGLLQAPAWALSFVYSLIAYASLQTRISTATDGWLDLIAADFFGNSLTRQVGESDSSYLSRIKANFFVPSNTRIAISDAVAAIAGGTPRIIEPWKGSDTGVMDGGPGAGMSFWDVDTAQTPGRWTDPARGAYFLEVPTAPLDILGNGFLPAYDCWSYVDTYTSSYIDISNAQMTMADAIIATLKRISVAGVEVFVRFLGVPDAGAALLWDMGGSYDDPYMRWDNAMAPTTTPWDLAGEFWDITPTTWDP